MTANGTKHFVLSYFAGCGGFSLGAIAAGCETLGVEYDQAIANLYAQNVGNVVVADVTKLDPRSLLVAPFGASLNLPKLEERRQSGKLLIWQLSPECKMFSAANVAAKKDTAKAMTTNSATSINKLSWHETVIQPDAIILENVKGYKNYEGYKQFCDYLVNKGYKIWQKVLNSMNFGVAQSRDRLIMIATKPHVQFSGVPETHSLMGGQLDFAGKALLPLVGWYDAIKGIDLPPSQLTQTQKDSGVPRGSYLIERVGYYKSPKVVKADEPCWALRSHLADDGHEGSRGRNKIIDAVIKGKVFSINAKALARLQSFPDWYQWSGKMSLDCRAIGNAVPPLMAQRIVEAIISSNTSSKN